MPEFKLKDVKKKRLSWQLDPAVLEKINKDPNYKKDSSKSISTLTPIVRNLLKKARELYTSGDFINCAKIFRQLGKIIRDLEYDIEIKGDYNEKNILNDLRGKEWLRHTKSWLVVDGKPSDIPSEIKDHPASYPPDLAKHFIEFFTKENDWVFDPFMGIGSTLVACMGLNRNCWGTELNPKYAEYAQRRATVRQPKVDSYLAQKEGKDTTYQVFNADCRESLKIWKENQYERVKFILTSPPYWNILADSRGGVKSALKQRVEEGFDQTYSDDARDLGNITKYEKYLEEIHSIFASFFEFMIPGGYVMIILQNVRPRDGIMRPLTWDLAKKLSDIILLRQEFIWCQDQKFMGIWGYPTTYVSNVHHHYCLVFQVPEKQQ